MKKIMILTVVTALVGLSLPRNTSAQQVTQDTLKSIEQGTSGSGTGTGSSGEYGNPGTLQQDTSNIKDRGNDGTGTSGSGVGTGTSGNTMRDYKKEQGIDSESTMPDYQKQKTGTSEMDMHQMDKSKTNTSTSESDMYQKDKSKSTGTSGSGTGTGSSSSTSKSTSTTTTTTTTKPSTTSHYVTELKTAEIPAAITKAISVKYPGYKTDKVFKGKDGTYKVTLNKGEEKQTVFLDASGESVKMSK